jgi:hypothetical protein
MAFILIVDIFNNVQIPVLKGLPILARNSFAGLHLWVIYRA